MKFGDFPKVSVEVTMNQGVIVRSRLFLSDAFRCTGGNATLLEWIALYAKRIPHSLALTNGTTFQSEVMEALQQIPLGKTISYQELALLCHRPRAARAVGNACNQNPFPLFVPCHRVIRSNGDLGGFAIDIEIKQRLLEFEGALVGKAV